MWKGIGRACDRRHPHTPLVTRMFGDARATEAVLTLRDTRVGYMVSLAPPEEEGEDESEGEDDSVEEEEGEEGGPGPP